MRVMTVGVVILAMFLVQGTPAYPQDFDSEGAQRHDGDTSGEIAGTVFPHQREAVRLSRPDGEEETVDTGPDGRFSFRGLEPGVYWILGEERVPQRVTIAPRSMSWRTVELPSDETRSWARSFPELSDRIRPGRRITVTLDTGARVEGHLRSVSGTHLTLQTDDGPQVIDEAAVWRIEARKRGYLWLATAAGAGMAAVGVVYCWRPAEGSVRASTYFKVVGIAAGIGAAVGPLAAHADDGPLATRELLFQRSKGASLTPVVSPHAVGATLSLGW